MKRQGRRRRTAVERERKEKEKRSRRGDRDRQGRQMNENTAALARERRSGRDIPGGAVERRKMRGERRRGYAGRLVKWGPHG